MQYQQETNLSIFFFQNKYYPGKAIFNMDKEDEYARHDFEIQDNKGNLLAIVEAKVRTKKAKYADLMIGKSKVDYLQQLSLVKHRPAFLMLYYRPSEVLYVIQLTDQNGLPRELNERTETKPFRRDNETMVMTEKEMMFIPTAKAMKYTLAVPKVTRKDSNELHQAYC